MHFHRLSINEWIAAAAVGLATGSVLLFIMLPLTLAGVTPMPKPLGLAFAQLLLGKVPMPVGLLFHLGYDAFWALVFVALFRDRVTFGRAAAFAAALWIVALVVFAPAVGWGFLGLAIGPKVILGLLLTHALYALFLWAFAASAFAPRRHAAASRLPPSTRQVA